MTSVALTIALAVRFALELALIVAAAVWAWNATTGWLRMSVVLAPILVITIWMLFLSPSPAISVPAIVRLVMEGALFLGIAVGLAPVALLPAILLATIWALDKTVLLVLGSP